MGIILQNVSLIRNPKTPWEVKALTDINFSIEAGDVVGIMGPSGAGKSTLLQVIAELQRPTAGKVVNTIGYPVGMVFQEPQRGFFAASVWDEVAFGPENKDLTGEEVRQRTINALKSVELPERLWHESPFHLSGGQQRRVALAAVLAIEPKVLLLDEPTVGLDWRGESMLVQLLLQLRLNRSLTLVIGSHDPDFLFRLSSKTILMEQGTVACQGAWSEWPFMEKNFEGLGLAGPTALQVWTQLKCRGAILDGKAPANESEAVTIFRQWRGDKAAWPSWT